MLGYRSLRAAAYALCAYGILGLLIGAAMLVVGLSTFSRIAALSTTLERERSSLVQSLRTASTTLGDTATTTTDFQSSVTTARGAADQASKLANDSAGNFRDLGNSMRSLNVLGLQPLTSIAPQFDNSADQLQQLAITLGTSRDALTINGNDIQRVSTDLQQLQGQLNTVADSLNQPGVLGLDNQSMLPFQIAIYGMSLLVLLQSAFSIVLGVVLYRIQRALGSAKLIALPEPLAEEVRTATTSESVVLPYRARG
jgi:hypothetical protein